jgi:uncharacterized protein (DUF4415 family)
VAPRESALPPDLDPSPNSHTKGDTHLCVPFRKQAVSIRLDKDVLEKFRATGPGWQSRINEALKRARV